LSSLDGVTIPFRDEDDADSSCYVMPIMVVDPDRQDVLRDFLRDERGIQTSLFYPPAHRFSAYRERFGEVSLPRTEDAADREITIPLYPHLSDDEQDHVVESIDEGLRR
jgi:dTDP-4-amino-4,6-dideoxygalactose transaminase